MAHGFLNHLKQNQTEVFSAGIETHGLNPMAVKTLKDSFGIDISHHTSNNLEEYWEQSFDLILTVCDHAAENCPFFPGDAIRIHQNFSDPSKLTGSQEEIDQAFIRTATEIEAFCKDLVSQHQL